MGAVRFSIDSGLVRELTAHLPLKVFVETGTYEGASVKEMLPFFNEVHTIELSVPLYAGAVEKFEENPAVSVYHGRSEKVLADIVPKLRRRAVLYWLDAHWCDEASAGEDRQCPLIEELEAIGSISDRSVVLIDDARLFMAPPPKPAVTEGWPQFSEVLERLSALNPNHELLVIDDVLVFFPPAVREPLREYAHLHAVDWLVELQASANLQRRLDGLKGDLATVRAQTNEQLRKRTDRVYRRLSDLSSTVEGLEKKIDTLGEGSTDSPAALEARIVPLTAELAESGSQLKGVLESLEGLGEELRRSQADSRSALDEGLQKTEATLDERLSPLAEALRESTEPQLESVFKALGGLRGRLRVIAERVNQLTEGRVDEDDIADIVAPLGTQLSGLQETVEPLERQLNRVRLQLKDLDERLVPFDQALEPVHAQLASLDKRVEPLEGQLGALNEQIEPLSGQLGAEIAAVAAELEPLRAQLTQLDERVEPLGPQLDERVEGLGGQLAELEGAIQALREGSINALPEEIASLAQRVDKFGGELNRLRPRIDRILKVQSARSEATLAQLSGLRKQMNLLQDRIEERDNRRRFARTRGFFEAIAFRLFGSRLGTTGGHKPRELKIPRRYRRQSSPDPAPAISVVTQTTDQPASLDRTIRSVLDQDYEGLEYIVENSAPSEKTTEVLNRYRDKVTTVEDPANGKPGAAMNQGLEAASGDVLGYVPPERLLLPGALAYVARYFEHHPDVDVVYGHRVLVDGQGQEVGRWILPKHRDEILSWADFVPTETLFWRRRVWDAVGGQVDEDLNATVDWDLLLRFRDVGARMKRVPRFLGAARIDDAVAVNGAREEADELRARVHGRDVSDDEAFREVRGYLRRHVVLQKLYRLHLLRY